MNKTFFEKFASKILKAGPFVQLILIVIFNNVHYYSINDRSYTNLFKLINFIGVIALGMWFYSIAYVANFHIVEKEKVFPKLQLMELCIVVYFFLGSGMIFFDLPQEKINLGSTNVSYSEPFFVALIYFLSGVFSIVYVSKILIYAETHQDVEFKGYYKTALLLIFPIVGIWMIDGRLKRLKYIENFEQEIPEETNEEFDANKAMNAITDDITLNKVEYKCKEGILAVYQQFHYPNKGEKAFLNNTKAPDGKYKIGLMNYITISEGRIA